jgi:hypothetical protein
MVNRRAACPAVVVKRCWCASWGEPGQCGDLEDWLLTSLERGNPATLVDERHAAAQQHLLTRRVQRRRGWSSPAALELGVRAVFAVPLQIGDIHSPG